MREHSSVGIVIKKIIASLYGINHCPPFTVFVILIPSQSHWVPFTVVAGKKKEIYTVSSAEFRMKFICSVTLVNFAGCTRTNISNDTAV